MPRKKKDPRGCEMMPAVEIYADAFYLDRFTALKIASVLAYFIPRHAEMDAVAYLCDKAIEERPEVLERPH